MVRHHDTDNLVIERRRSTDFMADAIREKDVVVPFWPRQPFEEMPEPVIDLALAGVIFTGARISRPTAK